MSALLAAQHVDVIPAFSLPLQSRALTVLLDMPESEADAWMQYGSDVFKTGHADHLVAYLEEQTDKADREDSNSIFGVLRRLTLNGRPLTRDERLGFAHITFAGGRDTVIAMITGILALFATDPAALEAIRREPKLIAPATEELMRFVSPLRVSTRCCIRKGSTRSCSPPASPR